VALLSSFPLEGNMEPKIQIGNHVLTEAQAITTRVALTHFLMETEDQGFKDDLGPIADAYRDRLKEILAIMVAQGLT
jgi:hypothetical protein